MSIYAHEILKFIEGRQVYNKFIQNKFKSHLLSLALIYFLLWKDEKFKKF